MNQKSKQLIKEIFNGDQFDRPKSNLLSVNVKGRKVYLCVRGLSREENSKINWHFYVEEMIATDDTYGDIRITLTRRLYR